VEFELYSYPGISIDEYQSYTLPLNEQAPG